MNHRQRTSALRATCIATALLLAGCDSPPPAAATASTPSAPAAAPGATPAEALVKRFNMGAGLESLAYDAGRSTTTFGALASQLGAAQADQRLRAEIARALPAYQQRWEHALALLYARHFSAAELSSLAAQGTASPYAARFRTVQPTVAAEMQAMSKPLLEALVTEALTRAAAGSE
jgi:hypothetical protein